MRILLTNDDGINAPGIRAMYQALRELGHDVDVFAPSVEKSAVSGSLTVRTPLRVISIQEESFTGQAVEGTPADCVKIALGTLLPRQPDLVVSGLNNGGNLGSDIFYSGTVGAASEGCMTGIPAAAVSRCRAETEDPIICARHAARLLTDFDWNSFPKHTVLNINYPSRPTAEILGIKCVRMAVAAWNDGYMERRDPFGQRYWWLGGILAPHVGDDTDIGAVRSGYISITPLLFDRTDYGELNRLRSLCESSHD